MLSRRSAILTAIGGLFSGLFGGMRRSSGLACNSAAQGAEPPADGGEILTPAERKAGLRRWFKKYLASGVPVGCGITVGGEHRILGNLLFENGTQRQIVVGLEDWETDEMAAEFRAEFEKNAKLFCPSLPFAVATIA